MAVKTAYIELSTKGDTESYDITAEVSRRIQASGLKDGLVTVSLIGSTGSISTIEYEDGLKQDIKDVLQKLIPQGHYHHDAAWGDGNGHAHLRSTFLGTSQTFPLKDGKILLGTWQQIIFIDFDNRPRQRRLVVQILGE